MGDSGGTNGGTGDANRFQVERNPGSWEKQNCRNSPGRKITTKFSVKTIDAHIHCYPAELTGNPRGWAQARNERHWADLVAPRNQPSIQGWATIGQTIEAMDAAGVDQAILLGWYWENEATCRWHNTVIAEWVRAYPRRFIGFAGIHPGVPPERVVDQLENARLLGLRGVGELHPGVQDFSSGNPGWVALANWCAANNWPVTCHATEAAGRPHAGAVPTPLNDFIRMAENHPRLKLILAHWGGGLPFFELNPRIAPKLANVVYDTSASPLLYRMDVFRHVFDLLPREKILYGSDYPLRIFPRRKGAPDLTTFLERIKTEANLNEDELRALLGENCRRILPER